jgi:hypothetical protein
MWFSWNPRWRLRSGVGRTDEGRYSEGDHDRPQPDLVAVGQPQGRRHLPFGDERSILASKIFDRGFLAREDDPRVMARDACGVDPDRRVRRAAEDALAIGQWNLARLPDHPASGGGTRRLVIGERVANVADEPVPEPVDGPDETRVWRNLPERVGSPSRDRPGWCRGRRSKATSASAARPSSRHECGSRRAGGGDRMPCRRDVSPGCREGAGGCPCPTRNHPGGTSHALRRLLERAGEGWRPWRDSNPRSSP